MDFRLSEEQLRLQALARDFAYREVQPRARVLDREADARSAFPADLIRRASELGFRTFKVPKEQGGMGADVLTEVIVHEELAVGDVGLAMTLGHPWREGWMLATFTTPEQRERFLPEFMADPLYLTSFAMTEEHAGSDHGLPFLDDVEAGVRTTAQLRGDEWVLNGAKRFITNGSVARLLVVVARTRQGVPWNQGISVFLVPSDAPGFRVGRVEEKFGLRLNQNAELIFEDCRIPQGNLVSGLHEGQDFRHRFNRGSKSREAARCLAIARCAYEAAGEYARGRIQGGRPIIQHQAIASRLAEMATNIELARTLIWRSAWMVDHDPARARPLEDMAALFASENAVRAATSALEIYGARGTLRDQPIEKLVRDAHTMLPPPIGNTALRMRLGTWLAAHQAPGELVRVDAASGPQLSAMLAEA
ncbi:MAG: acyl-CoA dehydrogenase family protein [Candidatus Dormibacteraceae bacterium]